MQRLCFYCGKPITSAQRSTKKYCDDNCKQLAFYKRQGLSLAGTLKNTSPESSSLRVVGQEESPLNDKPESQNEETEREEEESQENIPGPLYPTELEADDPKEADNDKRPEPFNVKEERTEERKEQKNRENELREVKSDPEEAPEPEYKWVESDMLRKIYRYRNDDNGWMFLEPDANWGPLALQTVKWVTLRLRCLIENIILLSNLPETDRYIFLRLADALRQLLDSGQYRMLPPNYPYTQFIKELQKKIKEFAKENSENEFIRFRLPLNRKAELIIRRHEIGDFVPKVKFSELNFSDDPINNTHGNSF